LRQATKTPNKIDLLSSQTINLSISSFIADIAFTLWHWRKLMQWLVYFGPDGGCASFDTLLNDGWSYHGLDRIMKQDINHVLRDLRSQGYRITGSFRSKLYEAHHPVKEKRVIEIYLL